MGIDQSLLHNFIDDLNDKIKNEKKIIVGKNRLVNTYIGLTIDYSKKL